MNKKINRARIIPNNNSDILGLDPTIQLLNTISEKLAASAVLNGGFDRLLYQIDGIEKSQIQIVEKVDNVHNAIYQPDDGLFARVASTKSMQVESISKIETRVDDLITWRAQIAAIEQDYEKETEKLQLQLHQVHAMLDNVQKFQSSFLAALKWTLAAFGGGIITLLFKLMSKNLY